MQSTTDFPRDLSIPMSTSYHPKDVEKGWSSWWESKGFYSPNAELASNMSDDSKFVIVIPPPNVTGSLHLGHTLTNAIQDTLTRWNRMRGLVTLWVPGVDHAGIATQSIVERHLLKSQGLTRHDIGREEFLQRVWQWKEKNGSHICYQLRRLGVSVDWSREAFTMNTMLSRAVIEAFVRLFDAGFIYRDTRLVSWCPHLKTALSDIEVNTEEIDSPTRIRIPGFEKTVEVGMLWYFKYQVADKPNTFIEVATTRLETMLGDVAVAVNPNDIRYKDLIHCKLIHPFFPDRDIRIIADDHVDMSFGTGAVKITPAHDKNDYDIAKRHGLPSINIFTLEGTINETGGIFAGQHRFECRLQLEKKLTELGLLTNKLPNEKKMQLPRCSRSQDIVEYMLVPQWWMNCKTVAQEAVEVVRNGELQIVPEFHKQTWYYWLENIKDWCISRQLWWGHQIPAYRVICDDLTAPELWVSGRNKEEACQKAKERLGHENFKLVQDEDVLDTWFSSGLFVFSVFGWPNNTLDMKAFFPTTLLETGHDILFFWVARMVMFSLLLLKKLPFKTVLLHAMVRDAHGKKMSKSLGNVIDPLEAIEGISLEDMGKQLHSGNLPEKEILRALDIQKKEFPKGIPECGADALRYGLLAYTSQGRSINLDVNRVVSYSYGICQQNIQLKWSDRWILHRLSECARLTNEALENYNFGSAVTATYNYWLYDLCDIYLELLKPRFSQITDSNDKTTCLEVLYTCLDRGLRLLHPMIPFVTEELYQRLPSSFSKTESISIAPYPTSVITWEDSSLDKQMNDVMSVTRQFRSLLVQLDIPPKDKIDGYIIFHSEFPHEIDSLIHFFSERLHDIAILSKLSLVKIVSDTHSLANYSSFVSNLPSGAVSTVVSDRIQIAVDPKGTVNLSQTLKKLEKQLDINQKAIDGYLKKMQAINYDTKVPENVRQQNSDKLKQLQSERCILQQTTDTIRHALIL